MKNDIHTTSRLMALAGGLMLISAVLFALCGQLAIGGILLASASCMFIAAYNFRIAENLTNKEEHENNEETTV